MACSSTHPPAISRMRPDAPSTVPKATARRESTGLIRSIARVVLLVALAACPETRSCSTELEESIPADRVQWSCAGCESSIIRSYVGDVIEPKFEVRVGINTRVTNARWSIVSSDPSVVEGVAISTSNVPDVVFKSLAKGTATVTARLESHTVEGQVFEWKRTVIVTDPPTTLVLTPQTRTLLVGQEFELKAEGRTATGDVVTHVPITWKASTSCNVVDVNLCGGAGNNSNPIKLVATNLGTIDIVGTFSPKPSGPTLQQTIRVHVVPSLAPYVTITVLGGASGPMAVGSTRDFDAVVREANGTEMPNSGVTWSIASASPSGAATVSQAGVATCVLPGDATVRATMMGGTAFAEVTIICSVRVATTVVVGQVQSGAPPLQVGLPRQFSATVRDQFQQTMAVPVTWSISAGSEFATVSSEGSVLCSNVGTGTVRASVNLIAFGDAPFTCTTGPAPEFIEIDPVDVTTTVGQNVTFRARLLDAQGLPTGASVGHRIEFVVGNATIAENTGGDVTSGVITTKAAGTTVIHARHVPIAGGEPTLSATATLRVGTGTSGSVAGVRITTNGNAMHMLVSPGLSQGALATALDASGNPVAGVNFRWTSTNPASVSVNSTTAMISALSAGGAIIHATAILPNNEDGPTGTFFVTVRPRGAIEALVQAQAGPGTVPATGATLRAYQGAELKATASVSGTSPQPGRVFIPGLLPGTYTVTISLPGYVTRTFENVVVTAESIMALNNNAAIVLQGN